MGLGGPPLHMCVRGSRRVAGPGRENQAEEQGEEASVWRAVDAAPFPCAGLAEPVSTPTPLLCQVCHLHIVVL